MFNNSYFYHKLTRKYITIFGNMFNTIMIKRVNAETNEEIERFRVPIEYGDKEKYFVRKESDPTLNRPVQVILPRMSFQLVSMTYDASRKQNSLIKHSKANTASGAASQYMGVPYDLVFELSIYARNIDDGLHIVEQVVPYFNPTYSVSVDVVPEIGIVRDIPIELLSVANEVEHEGTFDTTRNVYWTLMFRMKVDYYGPVTTPKIIRKVITNLNNFPQVQAGSIVRINTNAGNSGTYKIDDVVYAGNTMSDARAFGTVLAWSNTTGRLVLGGVQGDFKVNNTIRATSTNAAYKLASFDTTPLTYATIVIDPNPLTANVGDNYGYTTTLTEFDF